MNIPDINTLKPAQCREVVIKKNYPEFYKKLNDTYSDSISFSEKLYWYFNDIKIKPVCLRCGKPVKFINTTLGYAQYCCKACANKDTTKIEKTKQICIEKYGGIAPICSNEVKSKMKNTMLDRYGVENCQQNKEISNRTKETIINKYGGQGNASDELKQKYINTCVDGYGVNNSSKSETIKEKISIGKRQSIINSNENIIDYFEKNNNLMCICKCPHVDCNKCKEKQFIIESSLLANRISHNIEICTNLLPYNPLTSKYELCLAEFLDKHNIEYLRSVRNIISKELDLYMPSYNIAIEFNGVFHHSDERKPNTYHINKYKECQEKGIQLISIWEDQFINKQDIVKSIILSKLGIYKERLYARKCVIEKVDSKIANGFYTSNHLQSKCNASVHYALQYNNEIVAMMSFGKRSLGNNFNNEWELIRYCSKTHINIIGGASRLFNRFIKEYYPKCIISWSSNDISNGDIYKKLGFEFENMSSSYWYISSSMKRYHRSNFSKSNLIKKGLIKENDERLEREISKDLGFTRIFDSGQTKWIWKK